MLALFHSLSARLLPIGQYTELVTSHSGSSTDLRSLIRLRSPYERPGALQELSADADYWSGIPIPTIARDLWNCALRHRALQEMQLPPGIHFALIVQFASGGNRFGLTSPPIDVPGESPLAIWQLQRNLEIIHGLVISDEAIQSDSAQQTEPLDPERTSLTYDEGDTPLPPDVVSCLRDLLRGSRALIRSAQQSGSASDAVLGYVDALVVHMRVPGLSGWIACRCAMEFLRPRSQLLRHPDYGTAMEQLLDELAAFYDVAGFDMPRWYMVERLPFTTPLALRVRDDADPTPLHEVVSAMVREEVGAEELKSCAWLAHSAIPEALLPPLIDACRDRLPRLLRFVGDRLTGGPFWSRRLRIQDTRRILKICRQTNDVQTLSGAASVLANATFSRVAEPSLMIKIMAAAPTSPFVFRVLSISRPDDRDRRTRDHESKVAREVAAIVLDKPDDFPFHLVHLAAMLDAEPDATPNTPLFEERPELASFEGSPGTEDPLDS